MPIDETRCEQCGEREPDCDCWWRDPADRDCSRCAGEGWVECRDPIQCTRPHNRLGECQCGACGGTGNASDQTIW